MDVFLIDYDLYDASSEDYSELEKAIASLGKYKPILKSSCLVFFNGTAKNIIDKLKSVLKENDQLLVTKLDPNYKAYGFDPLPLKDLFPACSADQ